MTLSGIDGDEVTVHLPTRFLRDWVRSHYGEKIEKLWQAEDAPPFAASKSAWDTTALAWPPA